MLTLLLYAFVAVTALQLIYFFCFGTFAFATPKKTKPVNFPVSVIICAKNEAENLTTFLPSVIEQDYPDFEIVVINDASSDDTQEVLEGFQAKHSNIKIVNVENNEAFWGNKKYALTLGIKAASHEVLLFTDADCKPVSKQWIANMSGHFNKQKSIVLGYGAYQKKKFSFLNLLIRFETVMAAIQGFSYAKLGAPYTAVGRNLAYTKSAFFGVNGFINHMKIRSGDDDLFIKDAATSKNTAICFSQDSFTLSNPKTSFATWFTQKRRHVTTSEHYKFKHKFFLGLFYLSQVLFWTLAIILLSLVFEWKIVIAVLAIRLIIQYVIVGWSAKKLKELDILYLLPFLEFFLILIHFGIFIANTISKPNHWK